MGMGPIIWTCLALTVHQSSMQVWHVNFRNVGLPINRKDQERNDIKEFYLLASPDKGETWEPVGTKQPGDTKPFAFIAPKDGVYWFLIQHIDRAGNRHPDNPNRAKPSQIIIVDTAPPQVKIRAERLPNGEIRARWTANDQYPDPRSLRLYYSRTSTPQEGDWTPLGAKPSLDDEYTFPVPKEVTGDIRVRVQMKDQAGNVGEDVAVVPIGAASAPNTSSAPNEGPPIGLIPTMRNDSPSQTNQLTSQQSSRPVLDPAPGPGTIVAPQPPSLPSGSVPAPAQFSGVPIAANTDRTNHVGSSLAETPSNAPAVKIVKTSQVRLDFTVGKIGPSGLGNAAEVYVSLDNGKNWQKMSGDVPISLTPGADLHGTESVSGAVSVQLPKEAIIYGFIVAAKSKAGLAPPPPKPGDPPEVLVEWDATAPKGQLFRPLPDPSQPNALQLAWEAKDRNLAEKPITLEWAEQKDGPWNPIGEGPLPNTGQYPWRLPPQLPPRVYLRLTMRDLAGNEARAQTDKPELIDLSVPQTKIIGVGIAPAR
jgi:hypothetical protein